MEMQKRQRASLILLAVGAALFAPGCGGKQSLASRSAAAYREAVAKGVLVSTGASVEPSSSHTGHEHQPR